MEIEKWDCRDGVRRLIAVSRSFGLVLVENTHIGVHKGPANVGISLRHDDILRKFKVIAISDGCKD